ncbi:peptidoglycan-binding protein [Patescibacteria group bacterium]|nr:peptidoglycan-binding protein [Patescibacteria group bacterium]
MNNTKLSFYDFKNLILIAAGIISFFLLGQAANASYQHTFTISAYYSPLPGQIRYVTGSYENDIRLNGNGVHSADGTPVYPGMIAAPKTYAFGTKMDIPGIGTVAVHDRGGAIVTAGQRNQSFDRLDVWMGYGDVGLDRALNWGKRTVLVTVYGVDPNIKENVYLQGFSDAEKFIRNVVIKQKVFTVDLGYGQTGDTVGTLQEYLTTLGYYKGKIDKYYGDEVYKAVIAFQIDNNIIDRSEEFGAGYFGPQTRASIEAVFNKQKEYDKIVKQNLGKDDKGDAVKELQKSLQKLGYDIEVNGVYDEATVQAVFEFQKDNEIVNDENEHGAGYFGPKTFAVLSQKLVAFSDPTIETIRENNIVQASYSGFDSDLSIGDSGEEVKKLQEELRKVNLFKAEATGYYGEVTQHAIFKFQQKKGLISSKTDVGAGEFGPQTRSALNSLLGYRANTKQIIASRTATFNENNLIAEKIEIPAVETKAIASETTTSKITKIVFDEDLSLGSNGEDVQKLQDTLKQLGFFESGFTTDYFGETTQKAVIAFQKDQGIISSEEDFGAGSVGPQTRAALHAIL